MQTRSDVTAELKKLSRVQQRLGGAILSLPSTAGNSDDEGFALNRTDIFFFFSRYGNGSNARAMQGERLCESVMSPSPRLFCLELTRDFLKLVSGKTQSSFVELAQDIETLFLPTSRLTSWCSALQHANISNNNDWYDLLFLIFSRQTGNCYQGAAVIGSSYLIIYFLFSFFLPFLLSSWSLFFVAVVLWEETTAAVSGCVVNVYCGVVTKL